MPAYGLGNAGVRSNKVPTAPAATVTAANNGTSLSATTVQLGQSIGAVGNPAVLLSNREIPTSAFFLSITSSSTTATLVLNNTTASTNAALDVNQTGSGTGIEVNSISREAIIAQSNNNIGVSALSLTAEAFFGLSVQSWAGVFARQLAAVGNIAADVLDVRMTTAVAAANGLGATISYRIQTTTNAGRRSNELISKWTTAADATRVSEFILTGVDNAITADLLTISGSGATRLNKYGIGTFAGVAAFTLQVDANGNIVESAAAIQSATVVLTDAETRALVSTGFAILPTAGANKMLQVISVNLNFARTADYTNIDANAVLRLFYFNSGANATTALWESDGAVSSLLAGGANKIATLTPYGRNTGTDWAGVVDTKANFNNDPIWLFLQNGAAGDLTGGDAANTLTVAIQFTVIPI